MRVVVVVVVVAPHRDLGRVGGPGDACPACDVGEIAMAVVLEQRIPDAARPRPCAGTAAPW